MDGFVHSFQSLGAVDGPGLRFVVFMQGCGLRCRYCHNPDTWTVQCGEVYSAKEVADRIMRCRPYFGEDGGVTVSGGEALMQWEFVRELFAILKTENIHTALDTSGNGNINGAEKLLELTDLVICDIKFATEDEYRKNCGGSLAAVEGFLGLTEKMKIPLWVRHVVVPGLTDSAEEIGNVVEIARKYGNLRRIELLPFRKLCLPKYEKLGIPFPLADTPEGTAETVQSLRMLIPEAFR